MWGLPLRAAHWEDVCESSGTGSNQFGVKSPRPCRREIGDFLKQAVSSHGLVWGFGTSHFIQKFFGSRQKLKWFLYGCDKPGYEGDPRQMGHGGEFWQNVVHWRREWQTTSVFLRWEPHEKYEKAKRQDTEIWTPQVSRCQLCYREEWKNNSRKNEEMEPKQKQCPVVDVTGDGSKVQCCKEQYSIGTCNVRSMNQSKLEVVKQERAGVNINISS